MRQRGIGDLVALGLGIGLVLVYDFFFKSSIDPCSRDPGWDTE